MYRFYLHTLNTELQSYSKEYILLCRVSKAIKRACYSISANAPYVVTRITTGVLDARFSIKLVGSKSLTLIKDIPLRRIRVLNLSGSQITECGLSELSGLTNLEIYR